MCRWQNSTLINSKFKASETVWPIPQTEQVFLSVFKIKPQINEKSFEVGSEKIIYL